jgi:hypothetical protein
VLTNVSACTCDEDVFHDSNYCTRLYPLPVRQLLKYGSGENLAVDADFLALPLTAVSDAAISTANDVRV